MTASTARLSTDAYEHCSCVTVLLISASHMRSCMPRSSTTLRCLSSTVPFDDAPSSSWASPAVVAASSPPQCDRIRARSSVRTASRACLAAVLAQCAVSPLTCDWDASSLASRRRSRRRRRRSFHALGAGSSRSPGAVPLGPGAFPSSVSIPPDRPGRRWDNRPPIRGAARVEVKGKEGAQV